MSSSNAAVARISAREEAASFPGGFTVLMAVYGRDDARLFERALDSVEANTLRPDDFVLVVDGPVPEPLDRVISRLAERGGRVVRLPENVGLARALNEGLAHVRTEWIVRADADDVNLPDRFAKQAAAIHARGGELDLLGGAITEVDEQGAPLALRAVPLTGDGIARRLRARNPFNHMTVAYRTSIVREAGGYPEIRLKEDYGLWAALIARGARCANLADVLVHATTGRAMYRRRGGLRYARTEWDLQVHLWRLRQQTLPVAIACGLARAIPSCLPAAVRGWVYESLLRKRARPAAAA